MLSNPLFLLLVLALAGAAYMWFKRQQSGGDKRSLPMPPREDLQTLGLSEVRPATGSARRTAVEEEDLEVVDIPEPEPERPAPKRVEETVADAEEIESLKPRAASASRSSITGIAPLLDSLRMTLGARGVVLLRHDEVNEGYEVVGRSGEGFGGKFNFPAAGNALHRVPADGTISLLDADTFGSLVYHLRPDATVGHAAALAIDAGVRHLLVADRGIDDGPFASQQLDLLGDYADLTARLLGVSGGRPAVVEPVPPAASSDRRRKGRRPAGDAALADLFAPAPEPAADEPESVPEADSDTDLGVTAPDMADADEAPVPRRVILKEEIDKARVDGRPLAFALIGAGGDDTDAEDHEEVEAGLRTALEAAEGTERVERFGDSLMGAFGYMDGTAAGEWARRIAENAGEVHIGVALLADHHGPEDLRADAAGALQDAYERGETCVIMADD